MCVLYVVWRREEADRGLGGRSLLLALWCCCLVLSLWGRGRQRRGWVASVSRCLFLFLCGMREEGGGQGLRLVQSTCQKQASFSVSVLLAFAVPSSGVNMPRPVTQERVSTRTYTTKHHKAKSKTWDCILWCCWPP